MATSTVEIRSQQEITSSITRRAGSFSSSQSNTAIQEKRITSPLEDTISRRVEETAISQTSSPSSSSSPANDTRAPDNDQSSKNSWLARLQDMAARNQKRTTGSRTKKRQSTLLTHITTAKRPRLVEDEEGDEEEEMDTSVPGSTPKSALSERSARDDESMETDELDEDDEDDSEMGQRDEQSANGAEAEDHHLTSNITTTPTNGAWCTGDLERSIPIHDEDKFMERLKKKFSDVGISTSSNVSGYDSGDSQQVFVKAANLENEDDTAAADALSRVLHKSDFARMKVLGQFNDSFILVMLDGYDLFIVDQHASDEKYNFEDLQANTRIESQRLVV